MNLDLATLTTTHNINPNYTYYHDTTYANHDTLRLCATNEKFIGKLSNTMPWYDRFKLYANSYNFVLSGGYIFNMLADYKIPDTVTTCSDIDIFCYNMTNSKFQEFATNFATFLTFDMNIKTTIENKPYINESIDTHTKQPYYTTFQIINIVADNQKYQFINREDVESPAKIIESFHIDYVKVYFDLKDGMLYCDPCTRNVFATWECDISTNPSLNIKAMRKGMRMRVIKNDRNTIDMQRHSRVIDLGNFNYLCWLGIDKLDDATIATYTAKFENIWNYHPKDKSTIIMREKDIDAHRYLQSYLNTPSIDTVNIKKSSYMFSKNNIADNIPSEFKQILDYVNSKFNYNYNQIVVNWYENGYDHLPFHRDWTSDNTKPFYVTTVTLCENGGERSFDIKDNVVDSKYKYSHRTQCGDILTLGNMTNTYYKHGILQDMTSMGRRISITLRQFSECVNKNECVNKDECEYECGLNMNDVQCGDANLFVVA